MLDFDEVVCAALQLTPLEKVRLVERVVSTLEVDIASQPLTTFEGALTHLSIGLTDHDIDEVRHEMSKGSCEC